MLFQRASSIELPRRELKQSSTNLLPDTILFKQVNTPLSPIQHNSPASSSASSFNWNDSIGYQHYSVDASACIAQLQQQQQHNSLLTTALHNSMLRNYDGIALSEEEDTSSSCSADVIIHSSSSSSSSTDSNDSFFSPEVASPVRGLPTPDDQYLHDTMQRVKLMYVDNELHVCDSASRCDDSLHNKCYNPPNMSIRFIDATDTETGREDSDDPLSMSDIHFAYLHGHHTVPPNSRNNDNNSGNR